MTEHPTHDDVGNFCLRLGYISGALHDPGMRSYLLERGASEETIERAFRGLVTLADESFYRCMGLPLEDERRANAHT